MGVGDCVDCKLSWLLKLNKAFQGPVFVTVCRFVLVWRSKFEVKSVLSMCWRCWGIELRLLVPLFYFVLVLCRI